MFYQNHLKKQKRSYSGIRKRTVASILFYFTRQRKYPKKTYLANVGGMPATNYWSFSETGHTDEAKKELINVLGSNLLFDTPKPSRLIERVLQIASDKDSIILDSFAGSGTTAHAVLNMNKADGGNRKFILIEMMDYAESITAERVRRVINGYGEGKRLLRAQAAILVTMNSVSLSSTAIC